METVTYKNNKYIKLRGIWFIIGEDNKQTVTIGSFAKLQYPEIISKLEAMKKDDE